MKPEIKSAIKFTVTGAIAGAVIAMFIGFHWGGWTTFTGAEDQASAAVLKSEGAICAAQFLAQPDHEAALAKFHKVESWQQSDFIDKGGWDKMPGQTKPDQEVADACTNRLDSLAKN